MPATRGYKLEGCHGGFGGLELVQRVHGTAADELEALLLALGPRFCLVLLAIAVVEDLPELAELEDVDAATIG